MYINNGVLGVVDVNISIGVSRFIEVYQQWCFKSFTCVQHKCFKTNRFTYKQWFFKSYRSTSAKVFQQL